MKNLITILFLLCCIFCLGQTKDFTRNFKADTLGKNGFRNKAVVYDNDKLIYYVNGMDMIGYKKHKILRLLGKPNYTMMKEDSAKHFDVDYYAYKISGGDRPNVLCVSIRKNKVSELKIKPSDDIKYVEQGFSEGSGSSSAWTRERPVYNPRITVNIPIRLAIIRGTDTIHVNKVDSNLVKKDSLDKYILQHINYPEVEKEATITGTVYLSFILEKDGTVTNVKIMRGVAGGPGLGREAVRVLSAVPKLHPHRVKGYPARTLYSIAVKFELR
jgi:TonB family protein